MLRPWRTADVEPYARIVGDVEVMRHVGAGLRYRAARRCVALAPFLAVAEARRGIARLLAHWREEGFGEWAVEERESGRLVGQIGLVRLRDWTLDPVDVEVGWLLAREAWGRGYATEGGRASLEYGFEQLGLERVVSVARRANGRSERVMQRLGLERQGTATWKGGEVVWYALDREAWEARRHLLGSRLP